MFGAKAIRGKWPLKCDIQPGHYCSFMKGANDFQLASVPITVFCRMRI